MAYWLLKSEPDEYSWDDLVKRGAKGDAWTGVRNFAARKNLKDMKQGDGFFFYHTSPPPPASRCRNPSRLPRSRANQSSGRWRL